MIRTLPERTRAMLPVGSSSMCTPSTGGRDTHVMIIRALRMLVYSLTITMISTTPYKLIINFSFNISLLFEHLVDLRSTLSIAICGASVPAMLASIQ